MGNGNRNLFIGGGLIFLCLTSGVHSQTSCASDIITGSFKVLIDGAAEWVYIVDPRAGASGAVTVSGDGVSMTIQHGPRIHLGNSCEISMTNDMFWYPDFVMYDLSFTVDVSEVGCGCNAALYLVEMPAATITSCNDYYCDVSKDSNTAVSIHPS